MGSEAYSWYVFTLAFGIPRAILTFKARNNPKDCS